MVGTDYSHTDISANLGALESDARDPALIILDESRSRTRWLDDEQCPRVVSFSSRTAVRQRIEYEPKRLLGLTGFA